MPAVRAQLWLPGNTHKGYESQPAPGLDLSASRKGIRLSPALVRRGLGPARLGAVIAPRRCRYRHMIRSNRPGLCHASRARKWRREPLISYPCGAATHRRMLEPALILCGESAIRGRAGGGAGREGMIHDPAWHSYDHSRGAAAASADGDRYGCGPQPLGHVLRGLRRTVRGAAFVPLSQSEPKLLRPLQRVQESLPHELSPIGAAAR